MTAALTPNNRLVADRTLVSRGAKKGALDTGLHLEGVRDYLRALASKQEPTDFERSFSQMHLSFTGGRITAQLLSPNGLKDEPMTVSRNAFSQMATELLPGRGGAFLLDQADLGEHGEKLSTMAWAAFAKPDTKPRLFRSVNMKDTDGTVKRMLRSQHSQGYGTYDNLRFAEDLLANAGGLRDLPALDFHLSDAGMRLRFAGKPVNEITLREPTPMIEAWNSEVGLRHTVLKGGMWVLVCTNGMAHWYKKQEWHWRHFGDSDRVGRGVASAMDEIGTASSGVIDAYEKALNISIDDAFAWMEREMQGVATAAFTARAIGALSHETTTPGKGLASVVDAITLEAQEEDLFTQADMEALAANLLRRGLSQAGRGERILVEA
jgi:hypothetical protein